MTCEDKVKQLTEKLRKQEQKSRCNELERDNLADKLKQAEHGSLEVHARLAEVERLLASCEAKLAERTSQVTELRQQVAELGQRMVEKDASLAAAQAERDRQCAETDRAMKESKYWHSQCQETTDKYKEMMREKEDNEIQYGWVRSHYEDVERRLNEAERVSVADFQQKHSAYFQDIQDENNRVRFEYELLKSEMKEQNKELSRLRNLVKGGC